MVSLSTCSQACNPREDQYFRRTYAQLIERVKRQKPAAAQMLFPIDSTVVTLTSQLFWLQGYYQVKLLKGVNLSQGNQSECLIHFRLGVKRW
ncbi:MAG: hypothetical protein ACM37W_03760 [Actinomycetota bacterium]